MRPTPSTVNTTREQRDDVHDRRAPDARGHPQPRLLPAGPALTTGPERIRMTRAYRPRRRARRGRGRRHVFNARLRAITEAADTRGEWESGVELHRARPPAADQRRAGQGRGQRGLLVRLRPLLCARSGARNLEEEKGRVHRVRARAGDLGSRRTRSTPGSSTRCRRSRRGDLHPKVFDAIHRDGNMLAATPTNGARDALDFLKAARRDREAVQCGLRLSRSYERTRARANTHRPLPGRERAARHRQRQVLDRCRRPAGPISCSPSSTISPRARSAASVRAAATGDGPRC